MGHPTSNHQGRSSEDEFESFVKKSTLASSIDCHPTNEEDEHVLVLEFADKSRGRKPEDRFAFSLPPAMTPQQVQKLVETRNARFIDAVQTCVSDVHSSFPSYVGIQVKYVPAFYPPLKEIQLYTCSGLRLRPMFPWNPATLAGETPARDLQRLSQNPRPALTWVPSSTRLCNQNFIESRLLTIALSKREKPTKVCWSLD